MDSETCPLCGSDRIVVDEDRGELVCGVCGLVIGRVVYRGPEWRAYGYGDRLRRERAGAPITLLLHDLGLSTKAVSRRGLRDGLEKLRIRVLSEVHKISLSADLPRSVAETAGMLLRKLGDRVTLLDRSGLRALPASLLHLSLRIHGIPRGAEELSRYSEAGSAEILRCSARLSWILGIRSRLDPRAYVSRIVRGLGLPAEVEAQANKLYSAAASKGISQGRSSRALAAACVYRAAKLLGYRVSQRRVARCSGAGLATIRRRLRELSEINI